MKNAGHTNARAIVAGFVFFMGAAAFVLFLGRSWLFPRHALPAIFSRPDERVDIPLNWESFPVLDHVDAARAKRVNVDDRIFSEIDTWMAPLADTFVRYRQDVCTAGGSSCASAPFSLHDVQVGHLDANGNPGIATEIDCSGPRFAYGADARSCSPESLTLRRSPDGVTSVLTFRDPDSREKPVAAFTKTK